MSILRVRNLNAIRSGSASPDQLWQAFTDLIQGHDNLAQQLNGNPNAQQNAAPPAVNALTVQAKDGIFHAQITDQNKIYRGVNYHLQYDTSPSFPSPITVHLGPTRDYRANLGNQNLYWRAYSDYGSTSSHSSPVYHGGAQPIMVAGGGSASGPSIPPGKGSGTGQPGQISGYGPIPFRSKNGRAPKRQ